MKLLAANPAAKYGGTLVDSKFDLYQLFRTSPWAVPTALVEACPDLQEDALALLLQDNHIDFPVVCKPDVGFRSRGVRKHIQLSHLLADLRGRRGRHLVQTFVADPFEYAIYYYRLPGSPLGEIADITQRILPRVRGDGHSSISELIDRTPQWQGIRDTIRHRASSSLLTTVPAEHQEVLLTDAATLSQGAIFVDSRNLATADLARAIGQVASVDGFYVGKFDVKVPSAEHLSRGEELKLLEVNGVTSELNHIYDFCTSYRAACTAVASQLRMIFRIAAHNRDCKIASFSDLTSRMLLAMSVI